MILIFTSSQLIKVKNIKPTTGKDLLRKIENAGIIKLIELGTSYCTGSGTGLNYVYLVCNEQIWLHITIISDLFLISGGLGLIMMLKVSRQTKIISVILLVGLIILLGNFYNPEAFNFWWINVTGFDPIA